MEFGVPREIRDLEMRVGLTPAGAQALVEAGHIVYVEQGAGIRAGFADEDYRRAGVHLVYSAAEAYGRCDVLVKVARPTAQEHALFSPGQTIFAFFHLPVASADLYQALAAAEITAIAYEMVQTDDGRLPILLPMSEVAGRLAPIIAGQLLMNTKGGRGTLLSGLPGVPPAVVTILGGGILGFNAARAFIGLGAQVVVLDQDTQRLQYIDDILHGRVTTMVATDYNLRRAVDFADVVVGCVYNPGRRAPILISREMVYRMRPGTAILDFSIDQGGCCQTSRPTTLRDPSFVEEGVIHFCVPNVTASVARTTSYAITNATLPYLQAIGKYGLPELFAQEPAITRGVNFYRGKVAHPEIAAASSRSIEITLP